jgi:hypothetical protein
VTTVSAERTRTRAQGRPLLDRLLAVIPAVALGLAVLVVLLVEAWSRKTPWVFTDELEWTQISRSIAATGDAARRGDPIFFKTIYVYMIAPFWWLRSSSPPYAAVKYANVVIMSLTAVPVYLIARMLVSKRAAVIVAAASLIVPATAYVTSIVPDVLAYPYFALCSLLAIRALTFRKRLDIALAIVFLAGGYFVHQREFTLLPVMFAVAAAGLWVTGPRGREVRRNWSRHDTAGAIALVLGFLFVVNHVVFSHVHEWQVTTQYFKNRMIDFGLDAGLSLSIGLGLLPVIGGIVSLHLPDRKGEPAYRAFAAWTGTAIAFLGLYVAEKSAFLSLTFATLWEERPMIFLCPLLLIGTALVFESRRIDRRLFAGAAGFVLVIVLVKAIQLGWPYYDAPGSAIPAVLNYYRHWTAHSLRVGLLGVFVLSMLAIAFRRRRGVAAATVVLGFAWLLAGQIAFTVGIDHVATDFTRNLPSPLNWVDQADGGQPATYLGQAIKDPNGENLTEFWNRSIHKVGSLDGSAPGPGPSFTPSLVSPDGRLSGLTTSYVVADGGIRLAEPVAATPSRGTMVLYHSPNGQWHLLDAPTQVFSDGWCPEWCAYTYFKPHQHGTLSVTLSRTAYGGSAPPAHTTVTAGTVKLDRNGNPVLGRIEQRLHPVIENGTQQIVRIPVSQTPVRVEIRVPNADLIPPTSSDPRSLGVRVAFQFQPAPGT